jgi:hypothetical protein
MARVHKEDHCRWLTFPTGALCCGAEELSASALSGPPQPSRHARFAATKRRPPIGASRSARASPMPLAAPVTMTTLSFGIA